MELVFHALLFLMMLLSLLPSIVHELIPWHGANDELILTIFVTAAMFFVLLMLASLFLSRVTRRDGSATSVSDGQSRRHLLGQGEQGSKV
jgi:cation transporter-like permease